MDYDIEAIGNMIYTARKNKNLKQIELANILGISQSTYSKIENGRYDIPLSVLFSISSALDVSISWLLGEHDTGEFTSAELLEIEKYKQYIKNIRNK